MLEDIGKPFSGFLESGAVVAWGVVAWVTLAAAITADNADSLALFDPEGNISQCPEFAEVLPGRLPCQALQTGHDKLLEPVARSIVDMVALAEVLDADGGVGHYYLFDVFD